MADIATLQKPSGNASFYQDKDIRYFGAARDDIVAALPTGVNSAILEVGCGTGETGLAAMRAGKVGRYVGIEIDPTAGAIAKKRLTEVRLGNVETLPLEDLRGQFDALIVSEVFEHLEDPWGTARRLAGCLKPGAMVYASSPNVSSWRVIANLLKGRFDYDPDGGVYDQTHLRWFTPATYGAMFEGAGFEIVSIGPLAKPGWKSALLNTLTGGKLAHLFMSQIMVTGRRR